MGEHQFLVTSLPMVTESDSKLLECHCMKNYYLLEEPTRLCLCSPALR